MEFNFHQTCIQLGQIMTVKVNGGKSRIRQYSQFPLCYSAVKEIQSTTGRLILATGSKSEKEQEFCLN